MENKLDPVFAVVIVLLAVSWITILARIWARAGILQKWGPDDWVMLLAQLLFTGYCAVQIREWKEDLGHHLQELGEARARRSLIYFWTSELLYCLSTSAMKIAIALQLLRIVGVQRLHVWLLRGSIAASTVGGLASALIVILQCRPVWTFWVLSQRAHCISAFSLRASIIFFGVGIVGTDLALSLFPVWIVHDLQIRIKRKLAIVAILALGGVASVATIVRLPYAESLWAFEPNLFDNSTYVTLTNIEVGLGIIAGSIATLRPLQKAALGKFGIVERPVDNVRRMNTWHSSGRKAARRNPPESEHTQNSEISQC